MRMLPGKPVVWVRVRVQDSIQYTMIRATVRVRAKSRGRGRLLNDKWARRRRDRSIQTNDNDRQQLQIPG